MKSPLIIIKISKINKKKENNGKIKNNKTLKIKYQKKILINFKKPSTPS
jgi:hypothetical protein